MTAPATPDLREAVARELDPDAFAPPQLASGGAWQLRRTAAYRQADALLAPDGPLASVMRERDEARELAGLAWTAPDIDVVGRWAEERGAAGIRERMNRLFRRAVTAEEQVRQLLNDADRNGQDHEAIALDRALAAEAELATLKTERDEAARTNDLMTDSIFLVRDRLRAAEAELATLKAELAAVDLALGECAEDSERGRMICQWICDCHAADETITTLKAELNEVREAFMRVAEAVGAPASERLDLEVRDRLATLKAAASRDGEAARQEIERLRAACETALHEMCHSVAPRNSFTAAVDALDAALTTTETRDGGHL